MSYNLDSLSPENEYNHEACMEKFYDPDFAAEFSFKNMADQAHYEFGCGENFDASWVIDVEIEDDESGRIRYLDYNTDEVLEVTMNSGIVEWENNEAWNVCLCEIDEDEYIPHYTADGRRTDSL